MSTSLSPISVESWTLYTFGTCLIVSRIISRRLTLGYFSKLQFDDWLMLIILIPFTGTVVCANQVALRTNMLDGDGTLASWRPKMAFALEEFQITTTWLVKACLLVLYKRIFPLGKERIYIHWTSAYCLATYLVIQVLLLVWCRPASDHQNMWSSASQCTTYPIVALVFDTTSLVALLLPIPLIPSPRKMLLSILIVFGIFALIAGVLGRYYLTVPHSDSVYLSWYVAETAGCICFANLPFLNSLVTTTASSDRMRRFSSSIALMQWPRSNKSLPTVREQRLSSTTTMRTIVRVEVGDEWSECSVASTTPPTPVHTLRPTDPPPELGGYWQGRRMTLRDTDLEKSPVTPPPSSHDIQSRGEATHAAF
ncbi:hypothetical protein BCR34DRAFT_558914 [Clohesyomyces aquaticus]|uniref:Rhodopsin domain-containing protein n=1 Tax=Clohesyomyces aquaticus TaxID=1231657 RepID=A0A1Y1ZYB1_9PLEO|nr:hypothetical protein BCR34DRAFT_558914 [Clohesyomyces aquaticus]